jgi:DNA-binding NarL/FixJ family response regulator
MNIHWEVKDHNSKKKYFLNIVRSNKYLTQREAEVMCHIHNKTYSDIAKLLNLSKRTIELYAKNVMVKLNCSSKKQVKSIISSQEIRELEKIIIDNETIKQLEH